MVTKRSGLGPAQVDILLKIIGAGTEKANGIYFPTGESWQGASIYCNNGSFIDRDDDSFFIWRCCEVWCISTMKKGGKLGLDQVTYYWVHVSGKSFWAPPYDGWETYEKGTEPPPTVSTVYSLKEESRCLQMMGKILFSEKLSDIHFHCPESKIVHAHKVILAAASPYFAAVFGGPRDDEHPDGVWKTSLSDNIIKIVMKFIYMGIVSKDDIHKYSSELSDLALQYQLNELVEIVKANEVITNHPSELEHQMNKQECPKTLTIKPKRTRKSIQDVDYVKENYSKILGSSEVLKLKKKQKINVSQRSSLGKRTSSKISVQYELSNEGESHSNLSSGSDLKLQTEDCVESEIKLNDKSPEETTCQPVEANNDVEEKKNRNDRIDKKMKLINHQSEKSLNSKKVRIQKENGIDEHKISSVQIIPNTTCIVCRMVFQAHDNLLHHARHSSHINHKDRLGYFNSPLSRKMIAGEKIYPKLKAGEMFVTQFGVVKVIQDSRAPNDLNITLIPKIKSALHNFSRRNTRVEVRKESLVSYAAKLSRQRRHKLQEMWIHRASKSLCQNQVWSIYCSLALPKDILSGIYQRQRDECIRRKPISIDDHPWFHFGDDPSAPSDSYPDRIVECVMVKDERNPMTFCRDTEIVIPLANHSVGKNVENDNETYQKYVDTDYKNKNFSHTPSTRLFLTRRSLMQHYNPDLPKYSCKYCGMYFNDVKYLINHIHCFNCDHENERIVRKKHLMFYLEEIEKSSYGKIISPRFHLNRVNKDGERVTLKPLPKLTINKNLPGWILFNPKKSSIYPDVFKCLGFNRGSNNIQFVRKLSDQLGGSSRRKRRRSRNKRKQKSIHSNVKIPTKWPWCKKYDGSKIECL